MNLKPGLITNFQYPLNPEHPRECIFKLHGQTFTLDPCLEKGKKEGLMKAEEVFTEEYLERLEYCPPRSVKLIIPEDDDVVLEFWHESSLVAYVTRPIYDVFLHILD